MAVTWRVANHSMSSPLELLKFRWKRDMQLTVRRWCKFKQGSGHTVNKFRSSDAFFKIQIICIRWEESFRTIEIFAFHVKINCAVHTSKKFQVFVSSTSRFDIQLQYSTVFATRPVSFWPEKRQGKHLCLHMQCSNKHDWQITAVWNWW